MIEKIIRKMDPETFGDFLKTTLPGSRSRKLMKAMQKHGDEKQLLFRKVFSRKHTPENDYLLRNEIKILKKKTETFIATLEGCSLQQQGTFHYPLAAGTWCQRHSLYPEAEHYALKAKAIAEKQHAWNGLLKINRLILQSVQYSRSDYHEMLERMNGIERDHRRYLQLLAGEEARYADFIRAASYKLASSLRLLEHPFSLSEHVHIDLATDPTARQEYFRYKSLAYISSGTTAIGYLQQALALVGGDTAERIACMNAMAIEYGAAGNFTEAENLFVAIIQQDEFRLFPGKNSLLFNYISTLIKLRKYASALQHINAIEGQLDEPVVKERIYTMKCNCYIFSEDVKGIRNVLPRNLNAYDLSLKIYYRLLYLIYYIIKKDYELAEREIVNLLHTQQLETTPYEPLIKLFDKYAAALFSKLYEEKNAAKKKAALRKAAVEFSAAHPELLTMLPAMWLLEKATEV